MFVDDVIAQLRVIKQKWLQKVTSASHLKQHQPGASPWFLCLTPSVGGIQLRFPTDV